MLYNCFRYPFQRAGIHFAEKEEWFQFQTRDQQASVASGSLRRQLQASRLPGHTLWQNRDVGESTICTFLHRDVGGIPSVRESSKMSVQLAGNGFRTNSGQIPMYGM